MDGTLLDNNGNIPKEFGNIIEVLNLKNIKFAIASGRNYREAVHRFEKYKNDIIFICDNGSSVYYRDECIYCNTLDKDTIDKLISIGRNISNSYVTLSGDKGFYIEDESIANQIRDICLNKDSVIDVDNLNNVKDLIFKVNIYDLVNTEEKLKKLPNIGAIVKTPEGQGEVDGVETLKEIVKVKIKDGEIYKFKRFETKDIKVIKDVTREKKAEEEKEFQKELKELENLERKDSKLKEN